MFVSNISGHLMKLDCYYDHNQWQVTELLSNLVFEVYRTLTYHVILSGTFFGIVRRT